MDALKTILRSLARKEEDTRGGTNGYHARQSSADLHAGVSASLFAEAAGDAGDAGSTSLYKYVFACRENSGIQYVLGGNETLRMRTCALSPAPLALSLAFSLSRALSLNLSLSLSRSLSLSLAHPLNTQIIYFVNDITAVNCHC